MADVHRARAAPFDSTPIGTRHRAPKRAPGGFTYWTLVVLGAVVALTGVLMAAGGAWLIGLGGSWYYLPAGLGLTAAGILMVRANLIGIVVYWIVFLLTVIWALWEVGLAPWALVPRVLAPAVLAVLTLLLIPVARRHGGHNHGRR